MRFGLTVVFVLAVVSFILLQRPVPSRDRVEAGEDSADLLTSAASRLEVVAEVVPVITEPTPAWADQLERILAEENPALRSEVLQQFASSLADEEAIELLRSIEPEEALTPRAVLATWLVQRWASRAPAEAAAWAVQQPDTEFGHRVHRNIAIVWAEKDLDAALAWVERLPENGNKTAARLSLAAEAGQRGEATTAIALIADVPAGAERDNVLKYSASRWAAVDSESAARWAGQVSDASLRDELLGAMATDLGIRSPLAAAEFAATLPEGKGRDTAVVKIVRCWTAAAPDEAGAWVERFPEGDLRDAAMRSLVEVWAREDLVRSAEWLNRLPPGGSRDAAVCVYAPLLASTSPDMAALWARTIQDETLRTIIFERMNGTRAASP